jgi:hypothetical protein
LISDGVKCEYQNVLTQKDMDNFGKQIHFEDMQNWSLDLDYSCLKFKLIFLNNSSLSVFLFFFEIENTTEKIGGFF